MWDQWAIQNLQHILLVEQETLTSNVLCKRTLFENLDWNRLMNQIFKKQSFADEGSLLLQKNNITEYDMSHT